MNSYALRTFAALALVLALTAASAHAQSPSADAMRITIPFGFTAGGQALPAGAYTVKRLLQTGGAFLIQSTDGETSVVVPGGYQLQRGRKAAPPKLVFNVYEGDHYLAQVWMPAGNIGSELPRSKAERALAETRAQRDAVAVLARQP